MKVAQISNEKIQFYFICAVHSVMKKADLHIIKTSDFGHSRLQSERSLTTFRMWKKAEKVVQNKRIRKYECFTGKH